MSLVRRESLWSLEEYARRRSGFRVQVMEHKRARRVQLGPHLTLLFEDELTIRYQVQEMLRIERIFEDAAIEDELDAYNPLVPDGHNWKATMLLEFPDADERKAWLSRLTGIERQVWIAVDGHDRVFAIADEDLERDDGSKTSSVHFLRFELLPGMIADLREGAAVAVGVDHPQYKAAVQAVGEEIRRSLCEDLEG